MERILLIVIFGFCTWSSGYAKLGLLAQFPSSDRSLDNYSALNCIQKELASIEHIQLVPLSGRLQITWTGTALKAGMKIYIERRIAQKEVQLVGGLTFRVGDVDSYDFTFTDHDLPTQAEVSYRIIHRFPDGAQLTSAWQKLVQEGIGKVSCFPNPAIADLHLRWKETQPDYVQIKVLTLTGAEQLFFPELGLRRSTAEVVISVADLPPGVYLVYASDGVHHWTHRFLKR